jgi:F-type H+-transporting ATPase subunit b
MLKLGLVEPSWTFVFQILNTFILFLILRKLLFKPVTEFMKNREDDIVGSIKEAESKNKEADGLKQEYTTKLKGIEEEGRQIIKDASKRAEKRASEIVKAAEKEAGQLRERASVEINREREKAINSLKDDIASIAMLAASKVVEKDLDEKTHHDLVKNFIDEVGETRWQS